ncbi:MAG: carbonic anhydrase [Candidatus Azotimanducaceae bacterium]|jgi:carbonic anhydrase
MTDEIQDLLSRNKQWAEKIEEDDPGFFARLSNQQRPRFLWIGCSDSRVPANQITGLMPGEIFVHRNVANVVFQTDINCMSVVDFAIRDLQVRHIIICGHYGCAGVKAAMENTTQGVVDHWLSGIRALCRAHQDELGELSNSEAEDRLCELNVLDQVRSLSRTNVLQEAWIRGQKVDVHGWVYGVNDGLLRDLNIRVSSEEDLGNLVGC